MDVSARTSARLASPAPVMCMTGGKSTGTWSASPEMLERYEREMTVSRCRLYSLEHALEVAHSRLESVRQRHTAELDVPAVSPPDAVLQDFEKRAEDLKIDALVEAASIRRRAEEEAAEIAARAEELAAVVVAAPEAANHEGEAGDNLAIEYVAEIEKPEQLGLHPSAASEEWAELFAEKEAAEAFIAEAKEEARPTLQTAEQQAVEMAGQFEQDREASMEAFVAEIDVEREAARHDAAGIVDDARAESERLAEEAERAVIKMAESSRRDSDNIVKDAKAERETILEDARRGAANLTETGEREVRSMERRVRQIRSSLRDPEARFKNITSSTMAEFSMLGDLIDIDAHALEASGGSEDPSGGDDAPRGRGFYERRLAGLRSRLEASEASNVTEGTGPVSETEPE